MRLDRLLTHPAVPFVGRLLMIYLYLTSAISKVLGWSSLIDRICDSDQRR